MANRNGRLTGNAACTALSELGSDVAREAKRVLLAGGHTILMDAKARIHHISGSLSASGKVRVSKNGTVVSIIFDAKNSGYGYAKIVEFRPGHEHPYLYTAYDSNRDQIKAKVIESIRQAVHNHAVP